MNWPTVIVNQINQILGDTTEVERTLLFIGTSAKNIEKTLAVNAQSDFDALLGDADSLLKNDVKAAVVNVGQNWWGFIYVLAADSAADVWVTTAKTAQRVCSVEGVVLPDDVTKKTPVNQVATLRGELIAKYGRQVWFVPAVQGMRETEIQAGCFTRLTTLQKDIAEKAYNEYPVCGAMSRGTSRLSVQPRRDHCR